jgi:hypothetical protein
MAIQSEFIVYPNRHGGKMAAYWDRLSSTSLDAPFIILAQFHDSVADLAEVCLSPHPDHGSHL